MQDSQIRPAAQDGREPVQLSAIDRASVAVAAPDRPLSHRGTRLEGVRIPSRHRSVRRDVVRLYEEHHHLQRGDLDTVTRYAELGRVCRKLIEVMERAGLAAVIKQDGEPRRWPGELRQMADSLLRHEAALGLNAQARATLGLTHLRAADLAQLMSEGADG